MATKNQTNDNPIESAEKTLANLIAKRNKAAALREKDDAELASVSYHAHTGDRDAAEKLDAIRERSVKREVDIKSLDAAIAMAKQNVEAAKQAEAAEVERLAATELLGLCKVLREAGKQADAALSMLGEAAVTMSDTVTAINRLGATHPSSMQLMSLGERAVKSALIGHPWARGFEHLPPTERRNFAGFTSEWARRT